MRCISFAVCAVLLTASAAQAEIRGTWSAGEAVGAYTRYFLTMTPTAGEKIAGFDLRISLPAEATATTGFSYASGTYFSTAVDSNTHFNLQKSHFDEETEEDVADLLSFDDTVTSKRLGSAFSFTGNGFYGGGFTSPFVLAQAVIKSSMYTPANFTYTNAVATGAAVCNTTSGSTGINFVPEPGTLALLATGLVGLLAYAWRKRK